MTAYLRDIQYYLPDGLLTNDDLVRQNPTWDAEKIFLKTGIRQRHVAAAGQTAADMGFLAAQRLFAESSVSREAVDAVLFCTQSPDYFLPSSACLLQQRLKLAASCAAFDFNLGCSGFTYGLWMARALILSESARNVLLIVGDTYSRYCDSHDLTTVTIFGDAAAAALITADPGGALAEVGPSVVGTDGRGAENLIVRGGCARQPSQTSRVLAGDGAGDAPGRFLWMNGPEIFSFTLSAVRAGIDSLLTRLQLPWQAIDRFLFHQANRFMLEHLRRTMKIPEDRMPIDMEDVGNTVSATIPILIRRCLEGGQLKSGHRCVLAGFGVGYSWAMTGLTWTAAG